MLPLLASAGIIVILTLIVIALMHCFCRKTYTEYNKYICDEEIDSLLSSQICKDENKAFDYVFYEDRLPLGRVSAFLNNFDRTIYDEEPYVFYCNRSSRDNEFREYGCVIARTGVYLSKENPENKKLKEKDATVLKGTNSVIDFSGLSHIFSIGSYIFTINYKPNGIFDRYRFCSIDDKTLRNNVKSVCKVVIESGYNFSLLKGLNAEIVEEENLELNPAAFEDNYQEEYDFSESVTEQFDEADRIIDSKMSKTGSVATGIQAVKPKIASFFGEVKNLMNGARGHGYAAEYANNTVDRVMGKNVESAAQQLDESGRQVKAGADRLVNGVEIQTKYCKTASESIGAAFEKEQAKYIRSDGSGKMMQIEVPRDQYKEALEFMQKRIDKGQVPNMSSGEGARDYVRKGFFTYEQTCNIARAGTIESLAVDTVSGAVCCTAAASITSVIVFAISVWKGNSPKEAARQCIGTSLAIMGKGALIYTLTMQLSRKEVAVIFAGKAYTADGISQGFKAVSNPIHIASEKLAEKISGSGLATASAGKKLGLDAINGRQLIGGAVTIAVVFGPDIVRTLQGKISTKQLIKNSTIAAAGIAGAATAQAAVPVPVVPAIVGGTVAGMAAKKALDHFIEDDAKEMFRILKEEFLDMTMLIGLNEEEFEEVSQLTVRNKKLTRMLQKMFQAEDHRTYARIEIMQSAIIEVTEKRKRITKKEYKQGLIELMTETV